MPIQACLFQAYHRFGHPWKGFIGNTPVEDRKKSKEIGVDTNDEVYPKELDILQRENSMISLPSIDYDLKETHTSTDNAG